jgi:hypothetical protein
MILSPWYIRCYSFFAPKLLRFIQLQLFLTIFSFPLLVAWGLPISIMSCVGNLVFSPFLALFLLISCFIFFLELCCLPNAWFIMLLELLTKSWSWLIAHGSSLWLIGFKKPTLAVLFCVPLAGFLIIHHKKILHPVQRIVCFLALLLSVIVFLKYYPTDTVIIKKIPCNNGFVTVIYAHNTLTVIDPGVIGQRISSSWIEYTLLKELIQNFGTTKIDHLIVTKPGILTFDYCAQLCRIAQVSSLYLVLWQGESPKRLLQNYGRLRYELEQKKGSLVRIGYKPVSIMIDKRTQIMIEPLEKQLSYKETTFPSTSVKFSNDEQNCEIIS